MKKVGLAIVILLFAAAPCFPATFQAIELEGHYVSANNISGDGSIVVGSLTSDNWATSLAFQWNQIDGFQYLETIEGSNHHWGASASYDGSVIIGGAATPSHATEAFRWAEVGGFQKLGFVPGFSFRSSANQCSGDGSIVVGVSRSDTNGVAFKWTATDGITELPILAGYSYCEASGISKDGNVIVGFCNDGTNGAPRPSVKSFRWTSTNGTEDIGLPTGYYVRAISADASTVVGWYWTEIGGIAAFKWNGSGNPTDLGLLPTPFVDAYSVSGDGSVIVGDTSDEKGTFIWDSTNGIRFLIDVLQNPPNSIDLTGWTLRGGAISEDGKVITGWGYKASSEANVSWIANLNQNIDPGDGGGSGGGGGCFISSIIQ